MLFTAFYIAAYVSILNVHIQVKKITYKPYPIVIVCLLSYIIYSGCCHVYLCCKSLNMYALAETHVVCDVTTASPILSCQVYIPSIIHISKTIYLNLYLSIYTLGGRSTLNVAQKTATRISVIFHLCHYPDSLYPHHTIIDNLPRCDDGKRFGSNLITWFICDD